MGHKTGVFQPLVHGAQVVLRTPQAVDEEDSGFSHGHPPEPLA